MQISFVLATATTIALSACGGAANCLENCEQAQPFWQECMADDGTLCEGTLTLDCIEKVDAYNDCWDADFEGDDCDVDYLRETGVTRTCKNADEVLESCEGYWEARFKRYDADEKEEALDECETWPNNEMEELIADGDCDEFCDWM